MKINNLKNQSIFVDSCCFIYLFENNDKYADKLEKLFSPDFGDIVFTSSIITVSEVITKPIRERMTDTVDRYLRLFQQLPMKLEIIDRNIAIRGATIRAKFGFGLIDSYQIAVAESCECEYFLTNDKQLKLYKNIKVVLLSDLIE